MDFYIYLKTLISFQISQIILLNKFTKFIKTTETLRSERGEGAKRPTRASFIVNPFGKQQSLSWS